MKKMRGVWCIVAVTLNVWLVIAGPVMARGNDYFPDVSVEVVSDERGPLPKYDAGLGDRHARRSYVAALNDERYRIWVSNRSNETIGLVIAVDGRNIISGDKSYLGSNERMYILGPYQSGEYDGWRTGRNRVNRFYFTGMSDSYAAAWGDYTAIGVIAVAVYRGRHENRPDRPTPWDFRSEKGPQGRDMDRPMARGQREAPGTGYGESEWSPSRTVRFWPQDRPAAREFIKYEWYATLCKRGVIECRQPPGFNRFWPEPRHGGGYAPPPPRRPYWERD